MNCCGRERLQRGRSTFVILGAILLCMVGVRVVVVDTFLLSPDYTPKTEQFILAVFNDGITNMPSTRSGGSGTNKIHGIYSVMTSSTHRYASSKKEITIASATTNVKGKTNDKLNTVDLIERKIDKLKNILEREYLSFFSPMMTDCYASDVTFDDPLTSLTGISSYQNNVDMLGGRTLLGKILFSDAGIILHSVTGGDVIPSPSSNDDGICSKDIITRWTLRFTFKILPWKPTAVFSGVSVYGVKPTIKEPAGEEVGVKIVSQRDYWDSINIIPNSGGRYDKVDKSLALNDFIGQLNPNKIFGVAPSAMERELPYQLLRRGDGYEVRRYPSCLVARLVYERRDEGYDELGYFARGMKPLAPAFMEVTKGAKYMNWPLTYLMPGEDKLNISTLAQERVEKDEFKRVNLETIPERTIAVGIFQDASTEMVVRKTDEALRKRLARDGLVSKKSNDYVDGKSNSCVIFAQYDAIFTMGKRRGEVWIELDDNGHPWSDGNA